MVKRFNTEPNQKTRLQIIIDDQTVKMNEEKQKVRTSMYASDYSQCMRKVYFAFFPKKYPVEKFEPRVLRIFANGNDVHERLGSYLKRQEELDFHDEVDVPRDELDVHGRCDGFCTLDTQAVVVEFKSINKDIVEEAHEEHIGQLTWYLSMFKSLRKDLKEDFGYTEFDLVEEQDLVGQVALSGRTVEGLTPVERWLMFTQGEIRGEIIYESKPNQSLHHFPLDYDEDRAKKVRLWFQQLDWHVKDQTVPNVLYEPNRFPCSWGGFNGKASGRCPYYDVCWKNGL